MLAENLELPLLFNILQEMVNIHVYFLVFQKAMSRLSGIYFFAVAEVWISQRKNSLQRLAGKLERTGCKCHR